MPNYTLSPAPNKSNISEKDGSIVKDWLGWFNDIQYYILRLLNKYDNTKSGLATLVAGTIVIANTNIKSNSVLRLTAQNNSGTPGFISIVLNPGIGFTLNSSNALDTRTIFYEILEAF